MVFYKNRINHQQIVGKHCNAAARDKMLYYVRLNLSKYALSPIFTHEIPFINFLDFYLYPPLPPHPQHQK